MTDQKDEIKDLEDEMGIDDNWGADLSADIVKEKTEMSIIKKMIMRFSISLGKKMNNNLFTNFLYVGSIFSIVICLFLISWLYTAANSESGKLIQVAGRQKCEIFRMRYLVSELFVNDTITWENGKDIIRVCFFNQNSEEFTVFLLNFILLG